METLSVYFGAFAGYAGAGVSLLVAAFAVVWLRRNLRIQENFERQLYRAYRLREHDMATLLRQASQKQVITDSAAVDAFLREAEELLKGMPEAEAKVIASGLHQPSAEGRERYVRRIIRGASTATHENNVAAV
jgi:hypothetical protein